MNIIPLIQEFTNNFNQKFSKSFNILNLEKILINEGDNFTINFLVKYLNFIDDEFAKSKERKDKYYIKDHIERKLITSLGYVTLSYRIYQDKQSKHCYSFIRDDVLKLVKYQRMTNQAELELIKYAMEENMSQSARHALRNTPISRATVSNKIKNLSGQLNIDIKRVNHTPKILYIEMDEIHVHMQKLIKKGKFKNTKICPCAIVHEGHEETFTKRKKLKNCYNFASSTLSYEELWYVIYDYVSKRYDLSQVEYIFVSGDGAPGIKEYQSVFPNAIFVLDKFHYKKALKYIFKEDKELLKIADGYIRNKQFDDFLKLVQAQIKEYPEQQKYMLEKYRYILNNIEGILNQYHEYYKCPCSMEGHVSNRYARYITSSPYAFSEKGLANKLKLLVLYANNHNLTIDDYLTLKLGEDTHKSLVETFTKFKSEYKHYIDVNSIYKPLQGSIILQENNSINLKLDNCIKLKPI